MFVLSIGEGKTSLISFYTKYLSLCNIPKTILSYSVIKSFLIGTIGSVYVNVDIRGNLTLLRALGLLLNQQICASRNSSHLNYSGLR